MKTNIKKLSYFIKDYNTILNNISKTVTNVINKYQKQIIQSAENSSTLKQLQNVPLELQKPIPKKIIHWWEWYQHVTGLNSVEEARQKVVLLQGKLAKCHEIRHNINQHAFKTNSRMKEIYDQLLRLKRDDPNYVCLTIEENKNLQEQKIITEQLQLVEQEEKDFFIHFTIAINEYQAAQALNAQKFKYLSVLASTIVGLLSLIMTIKYNNMKTKEMNKLFAEINNKNEATFNNYWNSLKAIIEGQTQKTTETHEVESGWTNVLKKIGYITSIFFIIKGIIY